MAFNTLTSKFSMDMADFERLTAQTEDFQELQREMIGRVMGAVAKQEREALEWWARSKGVKPEELLEDVRPITDLSASTTEQSEPAIELTTRAGSW